MNTSWDDAGVGALRPPLSRERAAAVCLVVAAAGSAQVGAVWIAFAAAGIVLLFDPGGGSVDAAGVGFALAAAACWMAYIYLSKRAGAAFLGGSGLALAMAVGALIVLPAGVIQAEGALAQPDLLGSALVVALASSVLPYSLELEALRRLRAAVFGVLMSLDPAVAALAGFVVLHQDLAARQLLAIAMVVVASAGAAGLGLRSAEGREVATDTRGGAAAPTEGPVY